MKPASLVMKIGAIAVMSLWTGCLLSAATIDDLTMTLSAPGTYNRMNLKITAVTSSYGTLSATDTTDLTGTMQADFQVNYDSLTRAANVTGLHFDEQTPGEVSFTDMEFKLKYLGFIVVETITTTGVKATSLTPTAWGTVTSGTFNMNQHNLRMNNGSIDWSGVVGGSQNLLTDPVTIDPPSSNGTLTVTKTADLSWTQSSYSATMILPLIFNELIYSDSSASIYFSGNNVGGVTNKAGEIQATVSFTGTLTDPNAIWDTSTSAGIQAGSGNWNSSTALWSMTSAGNNPLLTWDSGSNLTAYFTSGASTSTVTITEPITAKALTFGGTGVGTYVIQSSAPSSLLTLTGGTVTTDKNATISAYLTNTSTTFYKYGAGTLTLTNTGANNLTASGGTTHLVNGTVKFNGGSGSVYEVGKLFLAEDPETSSAALYVASGTVQGTGSGDFWRMGGEWGYTDSYAYVNVSGGTLNMGGYSPVLGYFGTGVFDQTGGNVTTTGRWYFGDQTGGKSVYTISGGTSSSTTLTTYMGVNDEGKGVLNIRGTGVFSTYAVCFGRSNALAGGIVNLGAVGSGGGVFNTRQIYAYTAGAPGTLNFHGGTMQARVATTAFIRDDAADANFNVYVYPEGAVIDTNGLDVAIPKALQTPAVAGKVGVSAINLASGGSGYIGAPAVEITGGTGTGATAIATVAGGVVTGITVTNPGVGYTTGELLNVTLYGGGATTPATLSATPATFNAGNASGGLTKIGTGTLTLSGSFANTYTGMTTVNNGSLLLSKTANVNAIAGGGLTVGDGTNAATVQYAAAGTSTDMMGSGAVTINRRGTLDFNGKTDTVGNVAISSDSTYLGQISNSAGGGALTIGTLGFTGGGTVATSTGKIVLGGNVTYATGVNGVAATLSGNIDLNATRTFTVADDAALTSETNISAAIANGAAASGLTKSGAGVLTLTANNSYTGLTTVSAGTLQLGNGGAGGGVAGNISIAGGTLAVNRSDSFSYAGAITGSSGALTKQGAGVMTLIANSSYSGPTTINAGALQFGNGGAGGGIAGNILINAASATLAVNRSDGFTYSGVITGTTGAFTKQGAGVMTLTANSPYSGPTTVNAGILQFGNGGAGGGVAGNVLINTVSAALTVNRTDNFTYAGAISGTTGNFTKQGAGKMSLTGGNTFTGAVTVGNGTLALAGSGQLPAAILNQSVFLIEDGVASHTVGAITGSGTTQLNASALLTAPSVAQNAIVIGSNAKLTIAPGAGAASSPVPEPGTIVLLAIAGLAVLGAKRSLWA